jgi:hypothetical protein
MAGPVLPLLARSATGVLIARKTDAANKSRHGRF